MAYQRGVAAGELREDASQLSALAYLERLHERLHAYTPPVLPALQRRATAKTDIVSATAKFSKEVGSDQTGFDGDRASFFGFELPSFLGGGPSDAERQRQEREAAVAAAVANADPAPQGVYMFGGVGCGKTFIMDMFYENAPEGTGKRRVHFNEFMIDCHKRMHRIRQSGVEEDPIPFVARELIDETGHLLCFDEMQVTDIADAMVIRRLFDEMWQQGMVMVATSNRPPGDLYYNGIQRHLFLPFIAEVETRCEVHDFASPTDYRLLKTADASGEKSSTWCEPLGPETDERVETLWVELTKGGECKPASLEVIGRRVEVPAAATATDVARFSFDDLCKKPLGAADYIAIARAFHTVFITDIPVLTLLDINEVRRLITCIDALYEQNVKTIVSANAPIVDLFQPDGVPRQIVEDKHGDLLGTSDYVPAAKDEVFAFDRTVSRLIEMQSVEYKAQAKKELDGHEGIETIKSFVEGPVDDDAIETLWMRYDVDGNGALDDGELLLLLQDLSQVRRGHRNVPPAEVRSAAKKGLSENCTYEEFAAFVRTTSIRRLVDTGSASQRVQ